MKVDNPIFEESGEVEICAHCPFEQLDLGACSMWLQAHYKFCPTRETYAEACALAERLTKEAQ